MIVATQRMIAATVLGLALAGAGAAAAQQNSRQDLTEGQVRSFFDRTEQQMTKWVDAGAFDEIRAWLETTAIDGAEFWYDTTTLVDGNRVASGLGTLDKQALLNLSNMVLGVAQQGTVRDYELDIAVEEVRLLSDGAAALVRTEIHESGTLAGPPGSTETASADPASAAPELRIDADARCRHLLVPGQDGSPRLAATTCHAEVQL